MVIPPINECIDNLEGQGYKIMKNGFIIVLCTIKCEDGTIRDIEKPFSEPFVRENVGRFLNKMGITYEFH